MTEEPMVERVARALAEHDGIQICSDASYRHSSYGSKARAALTSANVPALVEALRAAEVTLRLDGIRMRTREMATAQNGVALLAVQSALAHTKEASNG